MTEAASYVHFFDHATICLFLMTTIYALVFSGIVALMKLSHRLQIENEKLFCDVSEVLLSSYSWEERAKHILTNGGQMLDFEEAMRYSLLFLPLFCCLLHEIMVISFSFSFLFTMEHDIEF